MNIEETVVQENETRTFTQEEVDAIVGDRLKRERAKYAGYEDYKAKAERLDAIEEANKSELERATERVTALQTELDGIKRSNALREMRGRVATETGVPASLLTAETEDDARKQAEDIIAFARPSYPSVRDGGEVRNAGKSTTRQQFADWFTQLN